MVFPEEQIAQLFEEICDHVHPLQREVSALLSLLVLAPHSDFNDVVLGASLGDDLVALLAFEQGVD